MVPGGTEALTVAVADADAERRDRTARRLAAADDGIGTGDDPPDCVVAEPDALDRADAPDGVPVLLFTDADPGDFAARAFRADVADYVPRTDGYDALAERVRAAVAAADDDGGRIRALAAFTSDLHGCETAAEALDLAADAARDVLAFDRCTLAVERDGYLEVAEERGGDHGAHMRMPADEGIAGETYGAGEPLLFDSLREHPATDADEPGAIVSVPVGDHGVFQAVADERAGFDERDLEVARLLCDHLAEALTRIGRERDLAEQEAFTRRVVDALPDPLYILDSELRFETFNDALVTATGYDPDELHERSALDLLPEDERGRIREGLAALPDDGEGFRTEVPVRTADGDTVPFQLNTTRVERDGEPLLVGVARDVSERERRERELERQNERLDEFAGVVSHDLRTPLNVAAGRLRLAAETGDHEHLDAVGAALDRMESLIEDALTLARDGRAVETPEPVEFGEIARAAWRDVAGDDAEAAFENVDTVVSADAPRLRRALENVMRNAVEHGSAGTPSVRVGVERGDGTATLFVADDGPGVPEREREKAVRSGYTTAEDGTGLGLGIVRRIADAHGWALALAESDAGGLRVELRDVTLPDAEPVAADPFRR
ncbi:GAF domain-containing sensor histidine kinase [Halosegnis marinus]|uniref:histidine kinase n=1 Tax=Halosegnis marinus TaxID=3034023 RepID=A0ABD5ZM69_9EURY|nr:PAS domain S-box protein [Halosegnis sp. DT85]